MSESDRRNVSSDGFVPDRVLLRELSGEAADERHGVNVVTRPPPAVREVIREAQARLRAVDDRQYFYPEGDLHLTVLEIHHSRPYPVDREEVDRIVAAVRASSSGVPAPVLREARVGFDRAAVTMSWLPADDRLERLREHLGAAVRAAGVAPAPRHVRPTAHVTFARYLAEPRNAAAWVGALEALRKQMIRADWVIRDVSVTTGANWYGRRERIEEHGPFALLDG